MRCLSVFVFCTTLFLCVSFSFSSAQASTLWVSHPSLLQEKPTFASTLDQGEESLRLTTAYQGASLPSQGSLSAALPFSTSTEKRNSGWIWGLKAQLSNKKNNASALSAAQQSAEFSLGRATIFEGSEHYAGLRGFMELSFHYSKLKQDPSLLNRAQSLGIVLPENRQYGKIAIGTASIPTEETIVGQVSRDWTYSLEGSFVFPIKNADQRFWQIAGESKIPCSKELQCVLRISHWHLNGAIKTVLFEELSDLSSFLVGVEWLFHRAWILKANSGFDYVGNANFASNPSGPSFELSVNYSF